MSTWRERRNTRREMAVLGAILYGHHHATEIMKLLGMSSSAVYVALARLEREGTLRSERKASDRREWHLVDATLAVVAGPCGNWSPALRLAGCSDLAAPTCDLLAGHAGWHKDSTSGASWGKRWTDAEADRG